MPRAEETNEKHYEEQIDQHDKQEQSLSASMGNGRACPWASSGSSTFSGNSPSNRLLHALKRNRSHDILTRNHVQHRPLCPPKTLCTSKKSSKECDFFLGLSNKLEHEEPGLDDEELGPPPMIFPVLVRQNAIDMAIVAQEQAFSRKLDANLRRGSACARMAVALNSQHHHHSTTARPYASLQVKSCADEMLKKSHSSVGRR